MFSVFAKGEKCTEPQQSLSSTKLTREGGKRRTYNISSLPCQAGLAVSVSQRCLYALEVRTYNFFGAIWCLIRSPEGCPINLAQVNIL